MKIDLKQRRTVNIYTDGSYNQKNASWAFVVIDYTNSLSGEIIFKDKGILEGDINKLWQIGGELKAVEFAIEWCKKNNYNASIYYDSKGVRNWISDLLDNSPKPIWKAKNRWTKEYREFIKQHIHYIDSLNWVKSHNGNKWNEYVDNLVGLVNSEIVSP